jgi:hypothetical protein
MNAPGRINESVLRQKWNQICGSLDERGRRRWAASEALAMGHGSLILVHRATGLAHSTIRHGIAEINAVVEAPEAAGPLITVDLGTLPVGDTHVATPLQHCSFDFPSTTFLLSKRGVLSILPSPWVGSDGTSVTLSGYGDAIWPRFRADNCASGRPNGSSSCRPLCLEYGSIGAFPPVGAKLERTE